MQAIADAFLKNRADILPPDVSQEFIVPPFFQEISIFGDSKSVRILGGRGCGKTMLLRYFCHGSRFSANRQQISDSEFDHIGLYFRPDTGFCALLSPSWLPPQRDGHAFSHYLTLNLLTEACQAVRGIDSAKNLQGGSLNLSSVQLGTTLTRQLELEESSLSALEQKIEILLADFDLWVRNPGRCAEPRFVHFTTIIPALAADLARHSPRLKTLSFRVFVDEFENLLERHREIVCDAIKHPQPRIAVHIAHKRDAVSDFKTSSDERIMVSHDIRIIDIEKPLLEKEGMFELLAAELFLFKICQAGGASSYPAFRPELLHDPVHLPYRLSDEYRREVVGYARQILPELLAPEIAREALRDSALRRRVSEFIKKGLEQQGLAQQLDAEELISEDCPEASVVLGAILNRKSLAGREAVGLFQELLKNGRTPNDPFYKTGGWVDNNLYGCLFHLYAGLPRRANIMYSGFSRFCKIASPNLRFFMELCHTTLLLAYQRQSADEISGPLRVSYENQAKAAQQVSDAMFEDIVQLGPHGDRLLDFARRLGSLFEGYNRRRSQSEPEINHFSVSSANSTPLSESALAILREAKIWSVLRETDDTKGKAEFDAAQYELVLNTIYAPHFRISYRKRRKITLSTGELEIILMQSDKQFEALLKQLVENQDDDQPAPQTGNLF
ncbi:ORC-CDC6 family AAA ATPase [Pseudomonas aeruginosa]